MHGTLEEERLMPFVGAELGTEGEEREGEEG